MKIRVTFSALALALLVVMIPTIGASALGSQDDGAVTFLPADVVNIATASADVTIVSTTPVILDGESFTLAKAQVQATDKGSLATEVLIAVPGGFTAEGHQVITTHQPYFEVGDDVAVALVESPDQGISAATQEQHLAVYTIVGGLDGVTTNEGAVMSQANAAGDFTLTGSKFGDGPVDFYVNASGSGAGSSATVAAVRRGFQTWEDHLSSDLDFTYKGQTTSSNGLSDERNVAYWTTTPNPGHTYLAQASWIATMDGEIIGFDIMFNRDYLWSNGKASGRFDIGTVTVHEAGHALGLGHSNTNADVMLPVIPSNTVKPLGPGDKAGAASLYPSQTEPINITSPGNGATLPCGSATINWSGPEYGTYAIHAGKTSNGTQYAFTTNGSNRSYTLTNLPSDGSAVHVRIHHKLDGSFVFRDSAVYSTCNNPIDITSPGNGGTLACGSTTIYWSGPTSGTYAVHAGKSTTGNQYAYTTVGNNRSYTLNNLPTDGSAVHVRIWHKPAGGSFTLMDSNAYSACNNPINITTPGNGGILACGNTTINWSGPTSGSYAIHAGKSTTGNHYAYTTVGNNRSYTLTNLPTDGSAVHVRIWYKPVGGSFTLMDSNAYSACNYPINITSPGNSGTLACGSTNIYWSGPTNGTYAIHAGKSTTGNHYAYTTVGNNRSYTLTTLPSDGSAVHVRIWYKPVGGSFTLMDSNAYSACNG